MSGSRNREYMCPDTYEDSERRGDGTANSARNDKEVYREGSEQRTATAIKTVPVQKLEVVLA